MSKKNSSIYMDALMSLFSADVQRDMKLFAACRKGVLDTIIITYMCYYHNLMPSFLSDSISSKLLCSTISGYDDYMSKRRDTGDIEKYSEVTLSSECEQFVKRFMVFAKNPNVQKHTKKNDLYSMYIAYEFTSNKAYDAYRLLALCIDHISISNISEKFKQNLYDVLLIPNNPYLLRYGTILTDPLSCGEPCIGREKEIQDIISILSRKKKNNPVLVGPPGVGKTAIAEGLAQYLMSPECPPHLCGYHIFSLSITSILAGTKYRGDYEERLNTLVDIVIKSSTPIIVFVDEIHTLLAGHSKDEGLGASDVFKPYLARSGFTVIGATTPAEYKVIENDKALERRFSVVEIREPSDDDTRNILNRCIPNYSEYHKVVIPEDVVSKVVEYSRVYIPNKYMPDKAFDLLDSACVHCRIHSEDKVVSESDVLDGLRTITSVDIPVVGTGNAVKKLKTLPETLKERIIGQDDAIDSMYTFLRRYFTGFSKSNKPIGSFLFVGPTGVGKTELCKQLAQELFTPESFIRFDMSEYMEKHSVSKLIGAPPGYVGYGEGGLLIEAVKHNPFSVILFDEIEKAHPDVFNALLQILDDGVLTDSSGYTAHFHNSLIIMTSNIGASDVSEKRHNQIGFGSTLTENDVAGIYSKSVKSHFKPEFLNRLDKILYFNSLTTTDIKQIVDIELDSLKTKLSMMSVELTFTDTALNYLYDKCFDREYGARFANRMIKSTIEDLVLDYLVDNDLINTPGTHLHITISKDKFVCKRKQVVAV